MESVRFTVSPSRTGWLLLDGDRIAEVLSSQFWAMKAADSLAYQRHLQTGRPTTILLDTGDGKSTVAGLYK